MVRPAPGPSHTTGDEVSVRVASRASRVAIGLGAALGPRFRVTVGAPTADGLNIDLLDDLDRVQAFRQTFPAAALLLIGTPRPPPEELVAAALHAGADGYLLTASPEVIAAHLRAIHRRLSATAQLDRRASPR